MTTLTRTLAKFQWKDIKSYMISATAKERVNHTHEDVRISDLDVLREYAPHIAASFLYRLAYHGNLTGNQRYALLYAMNPNYEYVHFMAVTTVPDLSPKQRYTLARRLTTPTALSHAIIEAPDLTQQQRYSLSILINGGEDECLCNIVLKADLSLEQKEKVAGKIVHPGYRARAQQELSSLL